MTAVPQPPAEQRGATDGLPASGGPWTRHGHPIPGVTVYPTSPELRPRVARCGGVPWCKDCQEDAAREGVTR